MENELIKEIKNLINEKKIIETKKKLDELGERFEELDIFAKEVKGKARNTGISRSVDVSELEPLFVKYNIKL